MGDCAVLDVSSTGSDSAATGIRSRSVSLLRVIAVDDRLPSEFSRESGVMLAQVSRGRRRAAAAAIAKPRGAERSCCLDARIVTPPLRTHAREEEATRLGCD